MGLAKTISGKSLNEWTGKKPIETQVESQTENPDIIAPEVVNESFNINSQNSKGKTFLMKYIKHEQFDNFVKILEDPILNINLADDDQNTPLHYAANLGKIEYIENLIKKNADLTKVNINNDTPLTIAFKKAIRPLTDGCQNSSNKKSYFDCVKKLLQILLKKKIEPSANEVNLLHLAASNPSVPQNIFGLTLEYCRKFLNEIDKNNRTPLIYASQCDNKIALDLIIEEKPDFDKNNQGVLALKFALVNNHVNCMIKLLEAGVSPHEHVSQDEMLYNESSVNQYLIDGDTVFLYAIKSENMRLAQLCLTPNDKEKNTKIVNARNSKNHNAFSCAIQNLSTSMARVLQPYYVLADFNNAVKNTQGETRYNSLAHQGATVGLGSKDSIDKFFSSQNFKLTEQQQKSREKALAKYTSGFAEARTLVANKPIVQPQNNPLSQSVIVIGR